MDELGLCFKRLLDKNRNIREKGGKKVRLTVAFFVDHDGQKVDKFVIIRKSKKIRCFRNMKDRDLNRPLGVHYFFNKKP